MHNAITYRIASHPLLALWMDCPKERRMFAEQIADIVIEAIGEPTKEMMLAGALAWSLDGNTTAAARRTWRWMIFASRPGTLPPLRRDRKGRITRADAAILNAMPGPEHTDNT